MDIQGLIDEYAAWLREKITFEKFGEYYEITTPYLDNSMVLMIVINIYNIYKFM